MQLLPPPGKGRPLALILFAIVLIGGYMLFVHWWFVAPHLAMIGEISQLKNDEGRFRAAIASRPQIEQRLQEVGAFESASPSFLPENDFDSAAAALFSRLKALVTEKAEVIERCELASHNPKRSAAEELYERVTISVHLRCDIDDFGEILHALESGKPLLFVDELNIYRQPAQRARGGAFMNNRRPDQSSPQGESYRLDIRFDIYGYLRNPGPGAGRA
jgi:general secretion pathway protein M